MDRELVTRAQQGDTEAFTRLADGLSSPFLAVARRILRDVDVAEDATQQALLTVWQRLPQLRDPDKFEAWSYRLLVRACYSEGRRVRHWEPAIPMTESDKPVGQDVTGSVIDRDQLERAFLRLSLDHRTVVVLRHYRHFSLDEIANALDIPVGTVASRLHYALTTMRSAIEADARSHEQRFLS